MKEIFFTHGPHSRGYQEEGLLIDLIIRLSIILTVNLDYI